MIVLQIVSILFSIASLVILVWIGRMVQDFCKSIKQVTVDTKVLDALTEAATIAKEASGEVRSNLEVQRAEFQRLVILLDRMDTKITVSGATGLRNEAEGQRVRDNLETAQAEVDAVAGRLGTAQAEVDRVADDLDTERTTPRPMKRPPRKKT